MLKFLSVTAHPDDEVLGFGGTAWNLSQRGNSIHNLILSGNVEARVNRPDKKQLYSNIESANEIMGASFELADFPNIKFNTVPHIKLVQKIESVIESFEPDFLFTHFPHDLNNDHYHTSIACQAAFRLFQRKKIKRIRGLFFMEINSSTDWSFNQTTSGFSPNLFLPIGKLGLEKKLEALSCYEGVMRPYPHPRSHETISGLSAVRGSQAGLEYAERFQAAYITSEFGNNNVL